MQGRFLLLTTLGAGDRKKGVYALVFDREGALYFTLHSPNNKYLERPRFLRARYSGATITLDE